jgi:hypothetical protein
VTPQTFAIFRNPNPNPNLAPTTRRIVWRKHAELDNPAVIVEDETRGVWSYNQASIETLLCVVANVCCAWFVVVCCCRQNGDDAIVI